MKRLANEFYAHPSGNCGRMSHCKECHKEGVRKWYAETRAARSAYDRLRQNDPQRRAAHVRYARERNKREPVKSKARNAVSNALRDGRLVRSACQCGALEVQAHHRDYAKPLDVEWLCFKCHREHGHGQVVTSSFRHHKART